MTYSSLTDEYLPVPGKCYSPRAYDISKVTVHHMAGDLSIEDCQSVFNVPGRQASSNYGIGSDGRIGCYVPEEDAAWTSFSYWNDNQAITIEVADYDTSEWSPSKAAYESTVLLCADICNRYGIEPTYTGDTDGSFTEHMMYQATACPGPWWHARMDSFVEDVKKAMTNERYGVPMECILHPDESGTLFYVCGTNITHLDEPDNLKAVEKMAEECGINLPHVTLGTKAAPWGYRFFQATGNEPIYRKWVLGEDDQDFPEPAPEPEPEPEPVIEGTPIMGEGLSSISQMIKCFKDSGHSYPWETYIEYGAGSIDEFCRILFEEATDENVRPEVVFAQAMHETGWLQFGGDVSADQCNFCGLGATGGGEPGASFDSVRMGLRAQVQHLKAYASTEPLNNECIDPRFKYVTRGCAPTVEDLGGRWAPSDQYGVKIVSLMDKLLSYEVEEEPTVTDDDEISLLKKIVSLLEKILEHLKIK